MLLSVYKSTYKLHISAQISQEFLFHYLKARQQNIFFYLMGFLCLHHSRLSKKRRIGKAKSVYINDIHIQDNQVIKVWLQNLISHS